MEGNPWFLNLTHHLGAPWGASPWDDLGGLQNTPPPQPAARDEEETPCPRPLCPGELRIGRLKDRGG